MFLKRQLFLFLFFLFQIHCPILIMSKNIEKFIKDEYDSYLLNGKTNENNLMVSYINIIIKQVFKLQNRYRPIKSMNYIYSLLH